jgi:hypothetical protein
MRPHPIPAHRCNAVSHATSATVCHPLQRVGFCGSLRAEGVIHESLAEPPRLRDRSKKGPAVMVLQSFEYPVPVLRVAQPRKPPHLQRIVMRLHWHQSVRFSHGPKPLI